jgi:polyisoprenyl-phosphate glycosyltransferase
MDNQYSPYISVVIPVYGCAASLPELCERLITTLTSISESFDVLMVHDASPDNAWEVIQRLATTDKRVKGIKLSRNFGQHRAITAGIDYARGEWVAVIDCDLQDPPEELLKLYQKAKEGYDVVFGKRRKRQDGYFKKLGSRLFYKFYGFMTESPAAESMSANFSIISATVAESYRNMNEQNRAYFIFINWLGFKRANIDIDHAERQHGASTYNLKKLFNLALDIVISQSNRPLRASIKFGFFLALLSFLYGVFIVIKQAVFGVPVEGWVSLMVSIYFIGGLLFANMGLLGLYIGKIFDETKARPIYVVKETTFEDRFKEH